MSLELSGLTFGYASLAVIRGVNLTVTPGDVVAVIGANGAGKTSLLRGVSGVVARLAGDLNVDGTPVPANDPRAAITAGIAHVPEGRLVYRGMTVVENLLMGGYSLRRRRGLRARADEILGMFPALARRRRVHAGNLSGGEQQMLAIGRALMTRPQYLLLDEPCLGLAPVILDDLADHLTTLAGEGIGILLAEENVRRALAWSTTVHVLRHQTVSSGQPRDSVSEADITAVLLGPSDEESGSTKAPTPPDHDANDGAAVDGPAATTGGK